jgi:hypothetical protein
MKLPKRFDLNFDLEIDLWKIRPGVYIDLRPFPYGMAEEAYVCAASFEEVYVTSVEELLSRIDGEEKLGLVLSNNVISSRFFLLSPDQDIREVAFRNFREDSAIDDFYIGDIGIERAYIVNSIDTASKRIIESQLPFIEPVIVRAIPASFAISCFIRSLFDLKSTYLIVECRAYEICLYSCAIVEGIPITLSSDVVKSNVSNSLKEKIIFMNHKAGRFFKTDLISQVFVVSGERSVMPVEKIAEIVSSSLKNIDKVEIKVVEEPFSAVKGAWLFEDEKK